MLTLGNWIFIGLWVVITILISLLIALNYELDKEGWFGALINALASTIVLLIVIGGIKWYNTNTASGIRAVKDYQSELNNGIDREITITAEDGREIFHYEGKIDIESNHTDNYIKFESEEGKRYIIYYGIQDTIQIIEK